jgi:hypothetical protein
MHNNNLRTVAGFAFLVLHRLWFAGWLWRLPQAEEK